MGYTHLDPGRELEISSHIYFSSSQSDLSELVKLSPDALKEHYFENSPLITFSVL